MPGLRNRVEGKLVMVVRGEHEGMVGVCTNVSPVESGMFCYHIVSGGHSEDVFDSPYPKSFELLRLSN